VGNPLPYLADFIKIELTGPGEIIGPSEVALIGGCIATWVKSTREPGTITIRANSTRLTSETIRIESTRHV
jgi:beta-galactosidase